MSKKFNREASVKDITALAEEVFGSAEKAHAWLHRNHLVLGASPIDSLYSEDGEREVSKILNAIAYGLAV